MIILRRLDVSRLEEEIGRARPLGTLELGLPGERLGVVLPLVPPCAIVTSTKTTSRRGSSPEIARCMSWTSLGSSRLFGPT